MSASSDRPMHDPVTVFRGEDFPFRYSVSVQCEPPKPKDLTGATAIYTVTPSGGTVAAITKSTGDGLTFAAPNVFLGSLSEAETMALEPTLYLMKLEVTDTAGITQRVAYGFMSIRL